MQTPTETALARLFETARQSGSARWWCLPGGLDLFRPGEPAAELHLLDLGVPFDVDTLDPGGPRPRDVLTIMSPCRELGERVALHLLLHDYDELRGALKPDARGRTWRGDLAALRRRLHEEAAGP